MRPRIAAVACALLLSCPALGRAQTCPADPLSVAAGIGESVAVRLPLDRFNIVVTDGVPDTEIEFPDLTAATDNTLRSRRIDTLQPIDTAVLLGNIPDVSPMVRLDDGSEAEFVAREDGLLTRTALPGLFGLWHRSLRRGSCVSDMLRAAPVVHLRRRATDAFRAVFTHDVVYVGTRYSSCAGSTTMNRIYALRATDGVTLLAFNEGGQVAMDAVSGLALDETPVVDLTGGRVVRRPLQGDTLFFTTDRTASVSQHSVWAIDVLTEQLRWSHNYGRVLVPPAVSTLRNDRLFIATRSGELAALRKSDGERIWTLENGAGFPFLEPMAVSPIGPERIALIDFLGGISVARDNGGTAEWLWTAELPDGAAAQGTPLFDDSGGLYVGADNGRVYQLDPATGAVLDSRAIDDDGTSSVRHLRLVPRSGGEPASLVATDSEGRLARHCIPFCQGAACNPLRPDEDADGVEDSADLCPASAPGTAVHPTIGCTIAQIVPCDRTAAGAPWPSHQAYATVATIVARAYRDAALITHAEFVETAVLAWRSSCGTP